MKVLARTSKTQTVKVTAYLPFTVYGERFVVTEELNRIYAGFVGTHIETGFCHPMPPIRVKASVPAAVKNHCHSMGRTKFMAGVNKARAFLK